MGASVIIWTLRIKRAGKGIIISLNFSIFAWVCITACKAKATESLKRKHTVFWNPKGRFGGFPYSNPRSRLSLAPLHGQITWEKVSNSRCEESSAQFETEVSCNVLGKVEFVYCKSQRKTKTKLWEDIQYSLNNTEPPTWHIYLIVKVKPRILKSWEHQGVHGDNQIVRSEESNGNSSPLCLSLYF